MRTTPLLLILIFTLSACSTGARKQRAAYREAFSKQKYGESFKILHSEKILKEKNSKLLYYMEKGLLHHAQGAYLASAEALYQAERYAKELYTQSVSKNIASYLVNDRTVDYYGPLFERSMVYAYLALNHYLLSQKLQTTEYVDYDFKTKKEIKIPAQQLSDKERRNHLSKARNFVMAWHAYLKSFQHQRLGEKIFKFDLLSKVLGATIHEAWGSRSDANIALQLYKDALKVLRQNYNSYRSLNTKSEKFNGNYQNLHKLPQSVLEKDYIAATFHQTHLRDFLHTKILGLTKLYRPGQLKRAIQIYNPSPEVISDVKSMPRKKGNITLVLQRGLISKKQPEKYDMSLSGALAKSNDPGVRSLITEVGAPILTQFAMNVLKLRPKAGYRSNSKALLGTVAGTVVAYQAGIAFELPKVVPHPSKGKAEIFVSQNGKVLRKIPLPLISPLSDIAEEATRYRSKKIFFKTGLRVALKHAAGIAAAYLTYRGIKGKSDDMDFLARSAAIGQYLLTAKAIAKSEQADTRHWTSLPQDIRVTHFYLPKGIYQLHLNIDGRLDGSTSKKVDLGQVTVASDEDTKILNHRLLN